MAGPIGNAGSGNQGRCTTERKQGMNNIIPARAHEVLMVSYLNKETGRNRSAIMDIRLWMDDGSGLFEPVIEPTYHHGHPSVVLMTQTRYFEEAERIAKDDGFEVMTHEVGIEPHASASWGRKARGFTDAELVDALGLEFVTNAGVRGLIERGELVDAATSTDEG
jgi:hypothetical protein